MDLQTRLQEVIGELSALRRRLTDRPPPPNAVGHVTAPVRAVAERLARPLAASPPRELTTNEEISPGVQIVIDPDGAVLLKRESTEEPGTGAARGAGTLKLSYTGRGWFSLEVAVTPEEIGAASRYTLALSLKASRRVNCRLLLADRARSADSDQQLGYFPVTPEERDYHHSGDFSTPPGVEPGRDVERVFIAIFEPGGDIDLELHSMQLSFASDSPGRAAGDGHQHMLSSAMAADELNYWEEVFNGYATQGNPYITSLFDPAQPIEPEIEQLVRSYLPPSASRARVLDVGCGPVSVLGKKGGGIEFDVLGVDPLTDEYSEILARHRLRRPHQAMVGAAETIDDLFASESFDFIYSRNALDHCADAPLAIRNMVKIAKPASKIFITVFQNEAESAAYSGLHRWNLDVLCDKIVVWNPGTIEFLDELVDGHPYEFRTYEQPEAREECSRQIDIVIYKNLRDHSTLTELQPGIFAQFSSTYGWLTIVATRNLDEEFQFFIHGFNGTEWIVERSFRWYNHRGTRSISLPPHVYTKLRVGQFYRDYRAEGDPYVNTWEAVLLSAEDKPQTTVSSVSSQPQADVRPDRPSRAVATAIAAAPGDQRRDDPHPAERAACSDIVADGANSGAMRYDAWLHWSVTENCNLQCEYCFAPRLNAERTPRIDIPRLLHTLEQTGKTFKITFTGGGEPFVVPNIVETMVELTKTHYIGFNTNLTYNRFHEFADAIDPSRVDYIHASCHTAELERTGLVDKFIENFLLLQKRGFLIYASEVAHPSLAPTAKRHREEFRSLGIELLYGPFIGNFDGRKYPESYTDAENALFFKPNPIVKTMRRDNTHIDFPLPELKIGTVASFNDVKGKMCNAGFNAAVVHANGDVFRCFSLKHRLGNIYTGFEFEADPYICPRDFCGCPLKDWDKYLYNKAANIYLERHATSNVASVVDAVGLP